MGKSALIPAIAVAFLLFAGLGGACLADEQQQAVETLAAASNISNSTMQSIFTMLCNSVDETNARFSNYYDINYTDLYWRLTKELLDEKIADIGNISGIVGAVTRGYLDNYTSYMEEKTEIVSQLREIASTMEALKEEISIEGSSEDIYLKIGELQLAIGALPDKYATKDELDSAVSNASAPAPAAGYQVPPAPDNTVLYAFIVIVLFCGLMWYLSKRGEIRPGQFRALFSGLKKGDETKSLAELEVEKLREELDNAKAGKKGKIQGKG